MLVLYRVLRQKTSTEYASSFSLYNPDGTRSEGKSYISDLFKL